ncbi:hypothetical protein HG536_0G01950 [Torulaspora globosa]|uniref:DNA replication complex GINS protein SLD5 n=1 Tax=Torulaspora globosa TaxID=48254 RepID=A0A7G3ZLF0_9SACH|nr:uncharacterized protein HG536_0G01950 [Torulaspora globosa]QLL34336.1 hypothetical protein HG536_0G01950 [Torulaspora globosa]
MDISIDDILAELDRDTTIVERSDPSSQVPLTSDGNTTMVNSSFDPGQIPLRKAGLQDDITPEKDYTRLMTLWRNERCSPELLPFPTLLMNRMLRRVQEQMEKIENISMGFYEDGAAGPSQQPNESAFGSNKDKLPLLCMEAELERVKFVIRSYLRCRMHKIDKYMLYLKQLEYAGNNAASLKELLSEQELVYHSRHFASLLKLFNSSVLRHMPPELQAVNDTEGSISMVDEPEWGRFVFLHVKMPSERALKEDPLLERNEFGKPCYIVTIQELNEDVELTVGGIYVMRYEVIRDLLRDGKVELI